MYRADPLLDLIHGRDAIDDELSARIKAAIELMLTEAFGRPPHGMTRRQQAIWDAVPAVWPNVCKLVKLIKNDKAVRGLTDVAPERALGQILKRHLNERQMEHLGITEHEARIWTKLRRISEVLIKEYQVKHGAPPWRGYRCSTDHFKQIRARILLDMQNDEQIAKIKLRTIEDYFCRFCDECREFVDIDDVGDTLISGRPWDYDTEDMLTLKKCIEQLDAPLRDVIDAAYFQDLNVIPIPPKQVEKSERGRSEMQTGGEFERMRGEAIRKLRTCFGERRSS